MLLLGCRLLLGHCDAAIDKAPACLLRAGALCV